MAKQRNISVYISYLLRHRPQEIGLEMDSHGWAETAALIRGINEQGTYTLDLPQLEQIVAADSKGRYRFNADHSRIKACQGHSIDWVEPELTELPPPEYLYHGTTTAALEKILESGGISKMGRHAVHMQADIAKAWQSALRWHKTPVVLKIAAGQMHRDGFRFGRTENEVWCTESVPKQYLEEHIFAQAQNRGEVL